MRPLDAPVKVSIDLTRRCDLACAHCRCADASERRRQAEELTLAEIESVLLSLRRMRVFRVALSGGEPTLREDFAEIAELAARLCVGRVFVSTNGGRLDAALLRRLRPWRERITFKFSLDGPSSVHDSIRGRSGLCETVLEAMTACRTGGFAVSATTALGAMNVSALRETASVVARSEAEVWNVVELLPVGAADRSLLAEDEALREAAGTLDALRDGLGASGVRVVARLPFFDGLHASCRGGLTECGVLADGSIVGCRLLPGLAEGSVRDRKLEDVWADPKAFAAFRRAALPPSCVRCPEADACAGGCKAYARAWSDAAGAADPRCRRSALSATSPPEEGGREWSRTA